MNGTLEEMLCRRAKRNFNDMEQAVRGWMPIAALTNPMRHSHWMNSRGPKAGRTTEAAPTPVLPNSRPAQLAQMLADSIASYSRGDDWFKIKMLGMEDKEVNVLMDALTQEFTDAVMDPSLGFSAAVDMADLDWTTLGHAVFGFFYDMKKQRHTLH